MKRNWLVVIITGLVLSACAGLGQESLLISEQDEKEMGAEYHQQLLAEMPEYTADQAVIDWVDDLGQGLAKKSDRPELGYVFTVIDSEEVNAFAIPGGYVYVTTGLLMTAESGAEVAAVIAHELGHISARHGVQAIEEYMIAEGISEILGGDDIGEIVSASIQIGAGLTFSQDQEREADSLGVKYSYAGGYNPWAMSDFFKALQGMEGGTTEDPIPFLEDLGELFSTHPPTAERISNVEKQITGLSITRDSGALLWDSATPLSQIQSAIEQSVVTTEPLPEVPEE